MLPFLLSCLGRPFTVPQSGGIPSTRCQALLANVAEETSGGTDGPLTPHGPPRPTPRLPHAPALQSFPLNPWAGPDPSLTTGFPLAAAHLGCGPLRPSEGSSSPDLLRAKRLSCGHSLL